MAKKQLKGKKPRACVPCHERKVRCDATDVGTPCSRCIKKDRVEVCQLVPNPRSRVSGRAAPRSRAATGHAKIAITAHGVSGTPPSLDSQQIVVEYYRELNALTILGHALGQPAPPGLVQRKGNKQRFQSRQEQEISLLSPQEKVLVHERRVYDLPSHEVRNALIDLFFRHIYSYMPIVNYSQFMQEHSNNDCSTFVLYAMMMTVLPLAPGNILESIGHANAEMARFEYFTRARTLFDCNCERSELALLQGSLLLSWSQQSFELNKTARFWHNNASRLAIQMGLHRCVDIRPQLDVAIYCLYRRIWWTIQQRDVLLLLTGFKDTRHVTEEECDTSIIELRDFEESPKSNGTRSNDNRDLVCNVQEQCFVHICKLIVICVRFWQLQQKGCSLFGAGLRNINEHLGTWRANLPQEMDHSELIQSRATWDLRHECILVMHLLSHYLEVVLCRTAAMRIGESSEIVTKISRAAFEGRQLIQHAMIRGVVCFMPPFVMDCVAQIFAIELQMMQSPECAAEVKLFMEADLRKLQEYFELTAQIWPEAKLYSSALCVAYSKLALV
ncbi:hypothetical protein K491DRAFT_692489 [Lophiostoma macrostomum CBS 122681]|uniref:Zn(2)-C6 fungal-type domain-containing protein n=1 Tax=Lophiostoma macrostomum CBS 122681 TaxID=1314788 RepID=A0A6A6TBK7_9PLEO|nr:hypothetical protein K491DRAFT_692489 [Lophiostoma macrostomum CBS 122681]